MKREIHNVGESVRARLTNETRRTQTDFQLIVRRYFFERFLARLSASEARNRFILKGAMLFQVWSDNPYRATTDLDLLRRGPTGLDSIRRDVVAVLTTKIEDDGVAFDSERIEFAEIRAGDDSPGIRCHFEATLTSIRDMLQIHLGTADVVSPQPETIAYPTLLDHPRPLILAYTAESVVAEKLDAMVVLGITNSRIKDFVDLHYLAANFGFDGQSVADAVRKTFRRRATPIPEREPVALTEEFWTTTGRETQVRAFARRARLDMSLQDLQHFLPLLRSFLLPVLDVIRGDGEFDRTWLPGGPWQ